MQEEEIFLKALECEPGTEQDALLADQCRGDARLEEKVRNLLKANAQEDTFFERTAAAPSPREAELEKPLLNGRQLGDFEIISELGRGGMGVVYKARQKSLNRFVALKVLPSQLCRNQRTVVRFRREAEAAARLHHTNIVPVYSTGEVGGIHFYAMEVIDGPSLDLVVSQLAEKAGDETELPAWVANVMGTKLSARSSGPTNSGSNSSASITGDTYFDNVARMIGGVASALQHAHDQGVIHRDIKPANLLLSADGRLSVNDFGLARVFDQAGLTLSGEFVGTPRYMSPEQITAGRAPLDHRTDVYSLGAVLYELLALQPPFPGKNRDEVVAQILHREPARPQRRNSRVPRDLETICMKALERDPERRYPTADEFASDLDRYLNRYTIKAKRAGILRRSLKFVRRNPAASMLGVFLAGTCLLASLLIAREVNAKNKEIVQDNARNVELPQLRRLVAAGEYVTAFKKAKAIQEVIPNDATLSELWRDVAATMDVLSEPSGARVSISSPGSSDQDMFLGFTPLKAVEVPRGCFVWKVSLPEHEDYHYIRVSENATQLEFDMVPSDLAPRNMVRIPGGASPVEETYFIDVKEVSNHEFQDFVVADGYEIAKYWVELIDEVGEQEWRSVVADFKDQSGEPGPAMWKNGAFPAGMSSFPVTGINWFEAAAYARFVGKSLPTIHHWRRAAGQFKNAYATIPFSNIGGKHAGPVDYPMGMSRYGTYHMAGNVREWCWNLASEGRRYQLGGSWEDPSYLYSDSESDEALTRSMRTGFRCIWHEAGSEIAPIALAERKPHTFKSPKLLPVSDEVFDSWKGFWAYSKDGLDPEIVDTKEEKNWTERVLEYGQPRSTERMRAHLFIPQGSKPPYQTILFFPGGSANKYELEFGSKKSSINWIRLNFLLRTGRAVCCPVYSGTYDRSNEMIRFGSDPHGHVEWSNRVLREVSRTIDMLETQPDIDHERIAYVGTSWGGSIGPRILAVEPRLKTGVLALGGLYHDHGLPQTNDVNFLPRVRVPVLMLNGIHDLGNPKEEVEYLFNHIATAGEDKHLQFFESGHAVSVEQLLEWTDNWLDKYLGPSQQRE